MREKKPMIVVVKEKRTRKIISISPENLDKQYYERFCMRSFEFILVFFEIF